MLTKGNWKEETDSMNLEQKDEGIEKSIIAMLRWNKAIWLVVPSHVTSFIQSVCFISV